MDAATALSLAENRRFRVTGLGAAEIAEAQAKPQGAAKTEAIQAAIDDLDVDKEGDFEEDGKPSLAALSAALGYEVTAKDLAKALGAVTRAPQAGPGLIDTAEVKAAAEQRKGRVRFVAPTAAAETAQTV